MKILKTSILYIILAISSASYLNAGRIPKSDFQKWTEELHNYYSTRFGVKDKYPLSCQIADAMFYDANCESLFDLPDPRVNQCRLDAETHYKNFESSAYALCQVEDNLKNQNKLKEDKSWRLVTADEMQDMANALLPLHKENKVTTAFGKHCGDFYKLSTMKDSNEWISRFLDPRAREVEPLKVKDTRFKQFKQLKYALCKIDMAVEETTSPDIQPQPEKETPQAALERKIKTLVNQGKLSLKEKLSMQDLKVLAMLAQEMEKEGFPVFTDAAAKKDKEEL